MKILWKTFFIGFGSFILFLLLCNWGVFGKMPSLDDIQNPSASQSSQVYAQDGTMLGKYYLQDRVNVEFKDIAKPIIDALVATEDKRFYDHSGIDLKSIARAARGFGTDGGASTITMQTAKNLFTENWATKNFLLRGIQKVKESIIAVKLEKNFTKEEILTLYLNTVEFSDNVFGIRNAAKTFFQKEPDRVTVEEAAVLIGMVNGPGRYNPRRFPKLAQERRNLVMNRMVEASKLDKKEAEILKAKPIDLNYKKLDETAGLGPYFRMVLGEELKKWCKEHKKPDGKNYDVYRDGLKVYTTINARMQTYAEEAVSRHIADMQKILNQQSNIRTGSVWKGYENVLEAAVKQTDRWRNMKKEGIKEDAIRKAFDEKIPMKIFAWNTNHEKDTLMTPFDSIKYCRQMLQAGFMAMDPLTGEVRAWVGGVDFKTFKYDHVNFNTKRQVGSTIKPLLYTLAIEDAGFTPNTTVQDVQQSFGAYGMVPATGASCTGGSMPMSQALAQSRNCASAYIMKQLDNSGNEGAKRFVDFLKKCNLQTKIDAYPSIALGSCEISLFEMMQAYSMLPGRGFNVKPLFITRIEDRNGNVLESFTPVRREVISDVTAYSVIKMMQGVMTAGTGRRIWNYGVKGEIAGKTGTTNDNSDAWFMGYTPQLLAGTWVGCDDRFIRFQNTGDGQGSSAALPIWAYFYNKVMNDPSCGIDSKSIFAKPDKLSNDLQFMPWDNGLPPANESADGNTGTSTDYENGETTPTTIKQGDILPNAPDANSKDKKPDPKKPDVKQPATVAPATKPKAEMPKKGRK